MSWVMMLSTVGMEPPEWDLSERWHSIFRAMHPFLWLACSVCPLPVCFCLTAYNLQSPITDKEKEREEKKRQMASFVLSHAKLVL